MLSNFEFLDMFKNKGFDEKDGYIYKDGVAIPCAYEIYLKDGLDELLSYIDNCVEEAALLDRVLEKPKDSEIFPVIEDETLTPRIYAHAQGKYVSRIVPATGDPEKALRNLKKKFPPKEKKYKGITYLATESPFLTASHILLGKPKDSFAVIPNQGSLVYIPRDDGISMEVQVSMIKKAMMSSNISLVPPGKRLEIIIPPEKQ